MIYEVEATVFRRILVLLICWLTYFDQRVKYIVVDKVYIINNAVNIHIIFFKWRI